MENCFNIYAKMNIVNCWIPINCCILCMRLVCSRVDLTIWQILWIYIINTISIDNMFWRSSTKWRRFRTLNEIKYVFIILTTTLTVIRYFTFALEFTLRIILPLKKSITRCFKYLNKKRASNEEPHQRNFISFVLVTKSFVKIVFAKMLLEIAQIKLKLNENHFVRANIRRPWCALKIVTSNNWRTNAIEIHFGFCAWIRPICAH